jgi:hypothetical protein
MAATPQPFLKISQPKDSFLSMKNISQLQSNFQDILSFFNSAIKGYYHAAAFTAATSQPEEEFINLVAL